MTWFCDILVIEWGHIRFRDLFDKKAIWQTYTSVCEPGWFHLFYLLLRPRIGSWSVVSAHYVPVTHACVNLNVMHMCVAKGNIINLYNLQHKNCKRASKMLWNVDLSQNKRVFCLFLG